MKHIKGLIIIFLVLGSAISKADVDCQALIGKWRLDTYDSALNAQRESFSFYNKDGSFGIISKQSNGVSEYIHKESGRWECDDGVITTVTTNVNGVQVEYTDFYEILELNSSYQKVKTVPLNCEDLITECDRTYEYLRW